MVSGTRCPAWSDQLRKWSESRAAAPKGRCPVRHRGEFFRRPERAHLRADLIACSENFRHPGADIRAHMTVDCRFGMKADWGLKG